MSYRSALVDRGRRLYVEHGARDPVLGELTTTDKKGRWFPCRLNPPKGAESRGISQAARHESSSEILLAKEFVVYSGDSIEVDSKQLGRAEWLVVGDPQPMRRRRALIGYVATVQRVKNL